MKKSKSFYAFFALLIILSNVLSACGTPGKIAATYDLAAKRYGAVVPTEARAVAQAKTAYYSMDQQFQALVAQFPLINQCFSNWSEAGREMLEGRYDQQEFDADGNPMAPTGVMNTPAAINALLIVEDNPLGLEECSKMGADYANAIMAWRQSNIDNFRMLWDIEQDLITLYYGDLTTALTAELLDYVGAEFAKSDLALYFSPPRVWYPTFNLAFSIYDAGRCELFMTEYPGQVHWSAALEECKLIGNAAYDVIFRPPFSQATRDTINTGIDDYQLPTNPTPSE